MVFKALFGGAIAVDDFPEHLIDASDLRQIPDNQEVFLCPATNVSIIVEVLQRVPEPNDAEAVKFHFKALAHDNNALSYTMEDPILKPNNLADQPSLVILRGLQRICKFNQTVPDDVDILIALFRVRSGGKSADVVVSENIPRHERGVKEKAAAAFDSLEREPNPRPKALHILLWALPDQIQLGGLKPVVQHVHGRYYSVMIKT